MNAIEKRATWSLSLIYAFRMFGLFIIFPVFAIYAQDIPGATPQTIGFALGVYGLTQACLQIPFGLASDKFGRKPVIAIGMVLFVIGSVIAATSSDMLGLIIGRAVQGSGAVAAVIMALASDVTSEQNRTKIMASIGLSIGVSFSLSLVLGPVLVHWLSLTGLFWVTAVLSIVGLIILFLWVPTPAKQVNLSNLSVMQQIAVVLKNAHLIKLDFSIFFLHMFMTSLFLVVPLALINSGFDKQHHWQIYLPVLLSSVVLMVPFIILAEKKKKMDAVFIFAIFLLFVSFLDLYLFRRPLAGIVVGLLVFFIAFNLMEALLPSLISKIAPANLKGGAMGVYTTSQFMGVFAGGTVSGWIMNHYHADSLLMFLMAICVVWLLMFVALGKSPIK